MTHITTTFDSSSKRLVSGSVVAETALADDGPFRRFGELVSGIAAARGGVAMFQGEAKARFLRVLYGRAQRSRLGSAVHSLWACLQKK